MAQKKSTLSKGFLDKLEERNKENNKIQTPSGESNVTAETLVALSGLMAGIWGGTQALSAVKEGFDPKSVLKGSGNKLGLKDLFLASDKLMNDIIKNDKHLLSKKGGEKVLNLISNIDKNITNQSKNTNKYREKILDYMKDIKKKLKNFDKDIESSKNEDKNTQIIKLQVEGNFDAEKYKALLEQFTDPSLDRLTEEEFNNGLQLIVYTLQQFNDLDLGKLTGNVSTQLGTLISTIDEDVDRIGKIDDIRDKLANFKTAIEEIHIDSEGGVFQDLQNIVEKLSNLASYDVSKINLKPLIDSIEQLNEEKLQTLLSNSKDPKVRENYRRLKELIADKDSGLSGIIDAIKDIASEGKNIKANEGIANLTKAIVDILKIDAEPANILKMKRSISLLTPIFEKDLKELIKIVKKDFNDSEIKNVKASLDNINGIFGAISSIGVNPLRIILAQMNIRMIKKNILKDILTLFREINEVVGRKEYKSAYNSIENMHMIFDLLTTVADINLRHKIRMLINFEYIRGFVLPKILKIFNSINNVANEHKETTTKAITDLKTLFDTLFSIADIDNEKINNMRAKTWEIDMIVDTNIRQMLEHISSLNTSDDQIDSVEKLNTVLTSLTSEFDNLPGLLKFYIAEEKYSVMQSIVDTDTKIVDKINAIKITKGTLNKYDNINDLMSKIGLLVPKEDNVLEFLEKLKIIQKSIESFEDVGFDSKKFNQFIDNFKKFATNFDKKGDIGSALDNLVSPDSKKLKDISESIKYLNDAILEMDRVAKMGKIMNAVAKVYSKVPDIVKQMVDGFASIDPKGIENAKDILHEFNKLIVMSTVIMMIGAAAFILLPLENLFGFAATLGAFILLTSYAISLATKKMLADSSETIHEFGRLILISTGVLLLGGLAYKFIDWKDVFGFGIGLGLFMWGMMSILSHSSVTDAIGKSWETMREFGYLIIISGATLILGATIYHFLNWGDLFGFAAALGIFIFAMTTVFTGAAPLLKKSLEGVRDLTILIMAAGFTLMLGSLIFSAVSWENVFKFVLMDALFTALMIAIFIGANYLMQLKGIEGKNAFDGARDFAILLIAAGFTLALGALIYKNVDWKSALLFTVVLGGFMIAVGLAYRIATAANKGAMRGAKEFAVLLLASAAILIVGGMFFTWFPELIPGTALFALILGTFMIAVGFAFKLAGKGIEKNMKTAWAMALLIAISGGMLLFAGWVMSEFPDAQTNIPIFTGCVLALNGGMAAILWGLSKTEKSLKKGIVAMLAISVALGITALAFKKLGETAAIIENCGGVGKFTLIVGVMLGTLALVSTGLVVLAGALGNGVTTAMAYLAIGVVLAGAAAIWVVADAMQKTAKALDTLSKVKPISVKSLLSNVSAIISIAGALAPITGMAPAIMAASIAVEEMAKMMSKVAEAVQNYASLKIPIYEGLKKVGYRQLDQKDFKAAAKNVSLLIKTLGGAVIDTYNKNPEIFEANFFGFGRSKFQIVCRSLSGLGPMLSSIAQAVQEYASLKVGVDYKLNKYGFLMPTNYRTLDNSDFKAAAQNVSHIIEVLGGAVIDSYDANPEIFETNFFGTSKFSKVTKSLSKLGPMLSTIAGSVKDYADLKVGEDYKKDEKLGVLMPTKYRHLKDDDFKAAARNVEHIITVLGGAIIKAYEEHPDYYETGGGFLGIGGSSPFSKTIKANMMLGTMISKIASSVKDYADLKVGEDYKKDDKLGVLMPTKYRHLKDTDFQNAARNVEHIITTLGGAIIKVYEAHPDYYESGLFSNSPFTKTIKANLNLAKLISDIAGAVKDYADFKVGEDYKKDEKLGVLMPTRYRHLTDKDFKNASKNVQTILSTLGEAIIKTYKDNKTMYDNSGLLSTGKSPFIKTINANLKLAELISTIGKSVKELADFKIGEKYEKNSMGILMPTSYRHLGPKDFKDAANNINLIITTLGRAIMQTYKNHEDWFDDGEDSIFAQACKAIGTMGSMINDIAKGIQAYADLKIAKYDNKGNLAGYDKIDDKMFSRAAKHIDEIVSTIGRTVLNTYANHEDWFDDGPDSKFSMACTAIGGMGEMIGSIAEGIQNYAELKVPTKWDDKGNPIEFKQLDRGVFESASTNVGLVVTNLGESIEKVYNQHEDWFKSEIINTKKSILGSESKETDPPFVKAVQGCTMMGEMISSIAEGIQAYAEGKMPTEWDKQGRPIKFMKLDDGIYKLASENIGKVITTIGQAITTVYENHEDWFKPVTVKTKDGGLLGSDEFKETDPPFMKALKSCMQMGKVISTISEGIQNYAMLKMPVYENGVFKGYEKMADTVFEQAGTNIGIVLTTLGKAINKTYSENKTLFWGGHIEEVTKACIAMGKMISGIASGIQKYANLNYPIEWNSEGKPIKFEKLTNDDFVNAANTIKDVLTIIGNTVAEVADKDIFSSFQIKKVDNMLRVMQKTASVMNTMSYTIKRYASMTFNEYDPKTNKIVRRIKITPQDITAATKNIGEIITTIGEAIVDTVDGNEEIFGTNILNSPAYMAATAVGKMGEALNAIARSISFYAKSQFPVIEFKNGKPTTKYFKLNEGDYTNAAINIQRVIVAIGQALKTAYETNPDLFSTDSDKNSVASKVIEGVKGMTESIQEAAKVVQEMAKIDMGKIESKLIATKDSLSSNLKTILDMYQILTQSESKTFEYTLFGKKYQFTISETIGAWMEKMQDPMNKVGNGVEQLSDVLVQMAESLKKVPGKENFNSVKFEEVSTELQNIIKSLSETMLVIDSAEVFKQVKDINDLFGKTDIFIQFIEKINEFTGEKINHMTAIPSGQLGIVAILFDDISSLTEKIDYLAVSINGMKLFQELDPKDLFNEMYVLEKFIDRINVIVIKSSAIKSEGELDRLSSIIDKYTEIIGKLKAVFSGTKSEDENKDLFGFAFGSNLNKTELEEQISFFGDNVAKIIDLSALSKEIGPEGLEHVSKGVSEIDKAMTELQGIENFTKHNIQLDKYVTTVNKLQITKIDKLTAMVKAMNTLANRMGNVDRLTEAIADKLSGVLDKLVKELKTAESVIKESEKIQKKRHEMIEKSARNVTDIMKQKLVVEISQVQDSTPLNTETQVSNGETPTNTNNGGGAQLQGGAGGVTGNGSGTGTQEGTSGAQGGTKVTTVDRNAPTGNRGGNINYQGGGSRIDTGNIESLLTAIKTTLQGTLKVRKI